MPWNTLTALQEHLEDLVKLIKQLLSAAFSLPTTNKRSLL